MWWRRLSRGQRAAALLVAYAMLYVSVSRLTAPPVLVRFVGAGARGERLPRVLLATGGEPLSDAEGARLCDGCFVTNNRGFLPAAAFDAVVGGDGEGARRYAVATGAACLRRRLRRCRAPPVLVPAAGGAPLTLCALCAALRSARAAARAP